jgi:deoxyribodipyrimidine photolyase-related protein
VEDPLNGVKNGRRTGKMSGIAVKPAVTKENRFMKTLRLILGDQLNENHSWFQEKEKDITYCLFEMKQETGYVKHHIQKVVAFFDAMRNFSKKLQNERHQIIYFKLDAEENQQDLGKNIQTLLAKHGFEKFEYLLPDEYRLDQQMKEICTNLDIPTEAFDTEHFFTKRSEFEEFFEGNKQYLMERFYRHMRKKHNILMDEKGEPEGGEWNYDKETGKRSRKIMCRSLQNPGPKMLLN